MIELLEQTGALRILIYLDEKHPNGCPISYIRHDIRISQAGLYNAIKKLIEAGLVEEKVTDYPKLRLIKLTEKGKKVAELAKKIKEILEEE